MITLTYEEKKSKFIAIIESFNSIDEANLYLDDLKKEHKKAKHFLKVIKCKNQYNVNILQSSEDGEPVSSMRKVRDLLEKSEMENIAVFIIRYYGGTNLGASNLDRIYFSLAMKIINEYKSKIK